MTIERDRPLKLDYPHVERGNTPEFHEWATLGKVEYRNVLGYWYSKGSHQWLVYICNNTDCPAQAAVRLGPIDAALEAAFPADFVASGTRRTGE